MLFIYNLLLLANFVIFVYLIYVVYSIITNQEQYLGKDKLDDLSNKVFKDLFDTKLKPYEKYKPVYLILVVLVVLGLILSIFGQMVVTAQVSQAQDIINNAAENYNNTVNSIPKN